MGCVGSLPRCFSLFNFLCLLASSVSDFCLDTGRAVVAHCWGEGCCKLILLACACSISSTLSLPLLVAHTSQALCCSAREPSEDSPRLHAPPGLSCSGWVLRKPSEAQISLGLHFVPFPGLNSSGVWWAQSLQLMAFPRCSVFWEYHWRSFSGGLWLFRTPRSLS